MSTNPPSPPLPNAPSSDVTNDAIAFALLPPPSTVSPALPQCAGATNLFQEKRPSDLASMGYSPAKKKGGRHLHCTGISPRDADAFEQYPSDKDDSNNADYSHTPAYKASRNTKPKKKRDNKVKLDSSYLVCLCPLTFNAKLFSRGHPQVYSPDEIA